MYSAVGFSCLVVVAVTTRVTGLPEQHIAIEDQIAEFDEDDVERSDTDCGTKRLCKVAGGKCQPISDECDGELRTKSYYCSNSESCGCCIPSGCVFGGRSYPNQAVNTEACVDLLCNKGIWETQGNIRDECGICTARGDPHIRTYDPHNLTNGKNPITEYVTRKYTGEFILSQQILETAPSMLFGVYAHFINCTIGPCAAGETYASNFNYSEPGIEVELKVPHNLFVDHPENGFPGHCNSAASEDDPKCVPKILVNGIERKIDNNGQPGIFYATDGPVLIFQYGACPLMSRDTCTILVVGSSGNVVKLVLEPSADDFYYFNIYPLPYLHDQLYGLCDTFTGEKTYNYTLQNGKQITDFEDIKKFIKSWKM